MKNILSENMQRFGTKNLTESAKKKLIVKSIMETINQHGLQEAVKSALNEDEGVAKTIVTKLITALTGFSFTTIGDDEQGVLDALKMIKDQATYDALLNLVKTSPAVKKAFGKNFSLVSTLIKVGGISSPGYDRSQAAYKSNPLSKLGKGYADEEWTPQYQAILTKFNPQETDFMEKASF
tara:strand:+ start:25406 stop:25945 length:540 start_codon:yes stop_codon:yes gene_type:complete